VIITGSGPIKVKAPRVNDRRQDPDNKFASVIVPRWARKSKSLETMGPLLYLHGGRPRTARPTGCRYLWFGGGAVRTVLSVPRNVRGSP
jgi:hypothetical protein